MYTPAWMGKEFDPNEYMFAGCRSDMDTYKYAPPHCHPGTAHTHTFTPPPLPHAWPSWFCEV